MAEVENYEFLTIDEAIKHHMNRKVNLIGVIIHSSFPRQSKGTDIFWYARIVDESHPKPGLSVNMFDVKEDLLPSVASGGDIILLFRVRMAVHDGKPYVVYNKKFSSFALYKGDDAEDFIPYQHSRYFCLMGQYKKSIEGLRKWSINFKLDLGPDEYSSLREIKTGAFIDLVCKVLHVCEVSSGEWMAYVWDGNDTPPNNIVDKFENGLQFPLSLQLDPVPKLRDTFCKFPTVGSVLRVKVPPTVAGHVGKWIMILGIYFEVHEGLWLGFLTPTTKLGHIPVGDGIISQREREYNQRLLDNCKRLPFWSFPWTSHVTEVDDKDRSFSTLMDVLTYSKVTYIFKCAVRVVSMYPFLPKDFCLSDGRYLVRLTLEDPTARIHAFAYREDGETFFDGNPSVDILRKKRDKLLGISVNDDATEVKDAPRNPPWIQVQLKSYYIDKKDVWGSRNYRIFGTKIMD